MEFINKKGKVTAEITSQDVKSFISSVLSWIVIPALVVYGYYYGNDASVYIVLFYMWIIFVLQLVVGGVLVLMLVFMDDMDWSSDALKDKKKIKAILKWNDKLGSKFHSFKMTTSTILHFGLAILIASTGAVWTAFIFTLSLVVFKYIIFEIVKQLYGNVIPRVKEAAEKLHTEEILDIVGKGDDSNVEDTEE